MVIAQLLAGAVIALSATVLVAAPAAADATGSGADQNPYGSLSSAARPAAPPGTPAARDEIHRGLEDGLSVAVPGLPAPVKRR